MDLFHCSCEIAQCFLPIACVVGYSKSRGYLRTASARIWLAEAALSRPSHGHTVRRVTKQPLHPHPRRSATSMQVQRPNRHRSGLIGDLCARRTAPPTPLGTVSPVHKAAQPKTVRHVTRTGAVVCPGIRRPTKVSAESIRQSDETQSSSSPPIILAELHWEQNRTTTGETHDTGRPLAARTRATSPAGFGLPGIPWLPGVVLPRRLTGNLVTCHRCVAHVLLACGPEVRDAYPHAACARSMPGVIWNARGRAARKLSARDQRSRPLVPTLLRSTR